MAFQARQRRSGGLAWRGSISQALAWSIDLRDAWGPVRLDGLTLTEEGGTRRRGAQRERAGLTKPERGASRRARPGPLGKQLVLVPLAGPGDAVGPSRSSRGEARGEHSPERALSGAFGRSAGGPSLIYSLTSFRSLRKYQPLGEDSPHTTHPRRDHPLQPSTLFSP